MIIKAATSEVECDRCKKRHRLYDPVRWFPDGLPQGWLCLTESCERALHYCSRKCARKALSSW